MQSSQLAIRLLGWWRNEMHLIAPSLSLDNTLGCKGFEVSERGVLQPSCELGVRCSCNKPMLPDILQYNLFQFFAVTLS